MNNLYPAKPNYKGKTKGWFGFPHHNHLVEYYGDITQRVKEITEWKPENELQIRYDHIVYVPEKLVPKYVKETYKKYAEAGKEYDEAFERYLKADKKYDEAYKKHVEAIKKYAKARKKYHLSLKKANKNPTLIKYLKQNTPFQWNGKELIFPTK